MKYKSIQFAQICFLFLIIALMVVVGCNNKNQNDNGTNNGGLTFNRKNAEPHVISSTEALEYTRKFKESRIYFDSLLKNAGYFKENPIDLLDGEYFNRDVFLALLSQEKAAGIRIYLGQDTSGTVKLIMVPATEKGDVLGKLMALKPVKIPGISSAQAQPVPEWEAMERGLECPNMCPVGSPFTDQR